MTNLAHRAMGSLPRAALVLALCTAIAPVGLGALPSFPPVADPPSTEHHVGKVVWVDLVTPDLASSKRFYSGLFGWTFEDSVPGSKQYSLALLDGHPVGGLFHRNPPRGERRQPAWLTFIAVSDVDAATRAAVEHGAKVLFEPRDVPMRGRQAVFADPEGAVFAVIASSTGDPPDYLAAPGDWIWSSLLVRDPATDAAFYQTLLGYDVFDLESGDGAEHLILASGDYARASVSALPVQATHGHPHWLNFIRVVSATDTTARAVALGGTVLVAPHLDRHGGHVAVVADPSGAPFGLMEWTELDNKAEPK
jgi:predicted enzyme related to lactoylglutathione lyase